MDPTALPPPADPDEVPEPYRAWLSAAAGVLRRSGRLGAQAPAEDVTALLTRTTVESLPIPPLGLPPTRSGDRTAAGAHRPDGPATARSTADWDVRSLLADRDPSAAATAAVIDLENGATSLWWAVGGSGTRPQDLPTALDGLLLDAAPVVLLPSGDCTDLAAARAFATVLRERAVPPAAGTSLGADPIGRALLAGSRRDPCGDLPALVELAGDLTVGALVADGTVAHRAGAGEAAALAHTLAVGVAYLRALVDAGAPLPQAFSMLELRVAVTDEQFLSMATLRAAQRLWSRIGEIVGADPWACGSRLHAVTSWPMMTAIDPWVNLMRTTVAAFAAAVAGAHAVTVLPFDLPLGVPDALGRRMAVAQSAVLMREAHVGHVQDPAAGAAAVEQLTETLAEAGWAAFQRIEEAGGAPVALQQGTLTQGFAAGRDERSRRIATRRQMVTGVTEFPADDPAPVRAPVPDPVFRHEERWARPFEKLRADPPPGPVLLVDLGGSGARRDWIGQLLTVGGCTVQERAGAGQERAGVGQDAVDTGPVALLVGSDEAYAEAGADAVGSLRAAGCRWITVAGRPSPDLAPLVDDWVAQGSDVLAFLHRIRVALSDLRSQASAGTAERA